MKNEIKEILNEIGYYQHIHQNLTLSPKELDILVDYIINLRKTTQNAVDHTIVSNKYASKKEDEAIVLQEEIRRLKEKMKTDIDLLKNYEFDKYNWNYMEQQAVAEYLEKEIVEEGE